MSVPAVSFTIGGWKCYYRFVTEVVTSSVTLLAALACGVIIPGDRIPAGIVQTHLRAGPMYMHLTVQVKGCNTVFLFGIQLI